MPDDPPDDLRAKVFRDRVDPAKWRVGKMDEDGGYEYVEVFAGPNAWQRRSTMRGTASARSSFSRTSGEENPSD
jgi:hypothetical protein